MVAGQVRLRWSSQAASRTLTGCGEWDVAAVEVEAAVDDVGQLELADLFAGQGVEGDRATANATAGLAEFGGRIGRGPAAAEVRRDAGEAMPRMGLVKTSRRPLRILNSDPAVLGEVAVAGEGVEGREGRQDVVLGDLAEGLATGFGPGLDYGRETADLEFDGRRVRAGAGEVLGAIRRA